MSNRLIRIVLMGVLVAGSLSMSGCAYVEQQWTSGGDPAWNRLGAETVEGANRGPAVGWRYEGGPYRAPHRDHAPDRGYGNGDYPAYQGSD